MPTGERHLLVSGGDDGDIERAAVELARRGFTVTVLSGLRLDADTTLTDVERVPTVRASGELGSGRVSGSRDVFEIGPLRLDTAGHRLYVDGTLIEVTSSEFALLEYLLRHCDRVITKQDLLTHLRGTDQYNVNVAEAIVSSLRRKLGPAAASVVETVRGVGYVVRSEPETA